jgi:membrane fusion protein (multidrug efflux system)
VTDKKDFMTDVITNLEEDEKAMQQPYKVRGAQRTIAIVAASVIAAAISIGYYVHSRGYESTDNAFLEGNVIQISPRVSGQVLRVLVEDNQHVKQGELLAEIDPADYASRLAEAQARLGGARAQSNRAQTNVALTSTVTGAVLTQADAGLGAAHNQVEVLRARLSQDEAGVKAATAVSAQADAHLAAAVAEAERAASDAARYRTLYTKDEVSKQMLDRAETDARAASANRDAASQAVVAAHAQLAQAQAGGQSTAAALRQSENQVLQAEGRLHEAQSAPQQVLLRRADSDAGRSKLAEMEAALQQAALNQNYTKIYASESGFITRKSVEPGNFVGAGQVLMALVSDRVWVVANFKETQLADMRPGQPVTVKVDAYPQLKLRGKIDSIQSGTGARFSMLPAENATGNYVKVVQRVPVKIVLLDAPPVGYRLGPGMSVEPEVAVR